MPLPGSTSGPVGATVLRSRSVPFSWSQRRRTIDAAASLDLPLTQRSRSATLARGHARTSAAAHPASTRSCQGKHLVPSQSPRSPRAALLATRRSCPAPLCAQGQCARESSQRGGGASPDASRSIWLGHIPCQEADLGCAWAPPSPQWISHTHSHTSWNQPLWPFRRARQDRPKRTGQCPG